MKKLLKSFCLSLSFIGIFWLLQGQTVYAAVSAPDFATLPINQVMISTAGKAGSLQGVEGHNYVQINDTTTNSSGAVWFNNPISFTRDFHLEMAFYIENAGNDSDGLAFVMQSSGANALAEEAGSTIGVWSNVSGTNPLNKGAIPNSLAIEFDTYYNNDGGVLSNDHMLDRDIVSRGHHIAWAFPGSNAAYTTNNGWLKVDKVLHHNNEVAVRDISDSKWHSFVVDYDASSQVFRYQVPDFKVDVSIPVDETFRSNLSLTNGASVYFGFTGANGGYAQNKAVAFVDVQGLVDIDLRTGVFQKDTGSLLIDTEFEMTESVEVDAKKEITYATYLNYDQTSDLAILNPGITVTLALAENLSILENVYFGNVNEVMANGLPNGGTPLEYTRDAEKLTAVLPKLEKGHAYILHFTVQYTGIPKDRNIDEGIPVETIFNGNAFVSKILSGGSESHSYTIKGILPPILTTGAATVPEAQKTPPIFRQNRKAFTEITLEDSNSTQAQLFVSDLFSQETELKEEDFTQKTVLEREDLSEPFQYTLALETQGLSPGTIYYFAAYAIDTEGNSSATHYFAIDFRGIVELKTVPESLIGTTVTINELARAMDSDGFALIKVPIATTSKILEVRNTSEGTWKLAAQTTAFMKSDVSLADEVQLVLYDPIDDSLFCTITPDKKVLFEQTPQGDKDFSLDLSQYDCYLRFAPEIATLSPGTYLGKVNWQLNSTITD